ncbi:MAG: aminopeptidase [Firmicutes bacterium]|nr:aminopeptidase [Bacillota bacterium]
MKSIDLSYCGRVAIEECARVKPGERVLVVTDTLRDQSITRALLGAAKSIGAEAMSVLFSARPGEPPEAVLAAAACADVVFLHTTFSLSHSSLRVKAQEAGARVISMPGVSEDGFLRTLSVDIRKLADLSNRVAERIAAAKEVRMTTSSGTDITMTLGHPVTVGDGLCWEPGELDFFPPGLILHVSQEGSVQGRAVVDGSITRIGRLANPVSMLFQDGRLVSIEGGPEAHRLQELLAGFQDESVYMFAAWGMGTNPGAALLGEEPSFEGERIYGWGHVSTGSNASFPGGTVKAPIHLDGIIANPTIYLDGEVILSQGQFRI